MRFSGVILFAACLALLWVPSVGMAASGVDYGIDFPMISSDCDDDDCSDYEDEDENASEEEGKESEESEESEENEENE
jgi:hypothetical protein